MSYSIEMPDGMLVQDIPDELDPGEAKKRIVAQYPQYAPPAPGIMQTIGENVAGGFGNALRGAGAAAAHYLGFEDTAQSLDKARADAQAKMDAAGGKSFTGETAATVGSLSPALAIGAAGTAAAPFTGGLSLLLAEVANAGLFGLPAFRDTYDAQIKEGASQSVAIQHALAEAGLATVGGKIIGSGGKLLSGGVKAGEALLPKLAAGAAEGAAFPEVGRVMEKGIDVANDRENDKSWLVDPQTAASSAAAFGLLRGVHHGMEAPKRARAAAADQEAKDAADKAAVAETQKQADAERQQKLQDPAYHQEVETTYNDARMQRQSLLDEIKNVDKEDPNAADIKAAAEENLKAFDEMTMAPATDAYKEVFPQIKAAREAKAKADADAATAAEADRQAKLADPQVQAALAAQMSQARAAHAQAIETASTAAKAGDFEAAKQAEAEIAQHVDTIRQLQPQIAPPAPPPPPTPRVPPIPEAQKQLTKLQKQYANALRTGEMDVVEQLRTEMAPLHKQVADYQDALATQSQRDADLRAQTGTVKTPNPMAAYVDEAQNEARAKIESQTGTDREVAAMGQNPMQIGVTRQQNLLGETEVAHPQGITAESLGKQVAQVPETIHPAQKFLLNKLQDNLPAVAANPEHAAVAADWLHRLALGPQTVANGEASRDIGGYREKDVAAMLAASEQGRRSETQQTLVPQYRALTPEQKTALVGTQGYRNREVTPQMLPTRAEPIQRAVQTDLAPQEQLQGKLFPTVQAFQKFLGSEALYKARVLGGQAVQTLSRAFQKIKPLEARIAQLEKAADEAQTRYQRTVEMGAKGSADAVAAQEAAQARLKGITDALDKELQPLQIQWMEARNALKTAVENNFDIADKIYQNATRFEMVKGDAAEAMKAVVDAKERLAKAVAADVSKAGWDEMRDAQRAIPVAEAFFETHRLALPEELNRYLKADRALNAQLEQAVKVEGQLQTAHDAAREALDRVAANQKRRPSVKAARSEAETAARAAKLQTDAAAKVAHDEKLAAGEAAGAVETAKRTSAVEKAALLKPVMDAQAARTAVPEKERVTLAGRKQGLTDAETAAIARAHAELPGRSVDATKRRDWLNQIDDAARTLSTARRKLTEPWVTDEEKVAIQRQIDKASVDVNNLLRQLGEKETSAEATNKKITAQLKRIEKLEGDGVGGANEPGIEQKLHDSRIKDLNRARKALTNLEILQDKQTGVKTKEKVDTESSTGRAADENDRIVDAMSDATIGLDKAEQEGNKMKIAFFKNQLTMLADGKLPPRKIGPLTKKERTAGNTRTGTEESKAGDMATSPQNKITQSGKRRGVTSHQAVTEGNKEALAKAERETEKAEADRMKEEAAKDAAAAAEAKKAPTEEDTTDAEEQALQDELDAALAAETVGKKAKVPTPAKTETTPAKTETTPAPVQRAAPTAKAEPSGTSIEARERWLETVQKANLDRAHGVHGATFADAAKWGAENTRSPIMRSMFLRLTDVLDKADSTGALGRVYVAGSYRGPSAHKSHYHPNLDYVLVNKNSGQFIPTLLHELMHAATSRGLNTNRMFNAHVQTLVNTVSTWLETTEGKAYLAKNSMGLRNKNAVDTDGTNRKVYGLKNTHEFMAELYSSRAFQKLLQQVPVETPVKNIFGKALKAIANFFGIPVKNVETVFGEAHLAAEEALRINREIRMDSTWRTSDMKDDPEIDYAPTATSALADEIIAKPVGFLQRTREYFGADSGLGFETKYVDMRAPTIKALKAAGDTELKNASYLIRKADARMSQSFSAMAYGALGMRKDAKGLTVIEAGHSKSAKDVFDAVAKVRGADGKERMDIAQVYLTAKRADRVGWDKLGFDPSRQKMLEQKAKAMMAEIKADPAQEAALKHVADTYNNLNRGLLEFMAASGRLPKAEATRLLQSKDYVPFYRVMKDGTAVLDLGENNTYAVGNIRNQPYLQALKGGDQMLLPLNEAVARNVTMMTDMAMRNLATKDVAYALQKIGKAAGKMQIKYGPGPASGHMIRFFQEPNPKVPGDKGERHVLIDTEGTAAEGVPSDMLAHSLEGSFAVVPDALRVFSYVGDVLRSGVTRNPMYVARQLIRDPMAAAFTGGIDTGVVKSVFNTVHEFGKQVAGTSKTGEELIKKGLIHSNIFTGDSDDMAKMAMQLAHGKQSAWHEFIAGLDHAAMKADGATRATMYESARRRGMSEQEAEMAAIEMMNFNKRGISPSVQMASRMIPFFNAQIQGLNVLYKAARGQMPLEQQLKVKEKFYNRAMMMAGATMIYAMAMSDDETYKNAKARDRYQYWMVPNPTGGEHFKIPIPFEVGFMFKALPEALVDVMRGKSTRAEWDALKNAFVSQIPGNGLPIPQAIKPVLEVVANHSFFTGQPIEAPSQQGLDSSQRFTQHTTEFAKQMAVLLENQPIESLQLSPLQIEALTRGYFGSLPLIVAQATNNLFATAANAKVAPDARTSDNPLYGSWFQKQDAGGATERAYIEAQVLDKAKATFDKYIKRGDPEGAKAYRDKVLDKLMASGAAKSYGKTMADINTREQMLRKKATDPVVLRGELDKLDATRKRLSENLLHVAETVH